MSIDPHGITNLAEAAGETVEGSATDQKNAVRRFVLTTTPEAIAGELETDRQLAERHLEVLASVHGCKNMVHDLRRDALRLVTTRELAESPLAGVSRTPIEVSGDEFTMGQEIRMALPRVPDVYLRRGRLCRVLVVQETRRVVVDDLDEATLAEEISRVVCFFIEGKNGARIEKPPPTRPLRAVLGRSVITGVATLKAVAEVPALLPDGTFLDNPGFDQRTGTYVAPWAPTVRIRRPSKEQASTALAMLLEPFDEFTFVSEADRSAVAAAVLTVACRTAIDGAVPAFWVHAPMSRSGKGLLTRLIMLIALGRTVPPKQWPVKEEERTKVITSDLREGQGEHGPEVVFYDNVRAVIAGTAIESAITERGYSNRILGSSENVTIEKLQTVFFFNGNNLELGGDMPGRVIPIRLDSTTEKPEQRTFRRTEGELVDHVRARHRDLREAALLVAAAYLQSDQDHEAPEPALGGFGRWSSLVRGSLVWLGQEDPIATREIVEVSNDQGDHDRDLVRLALACVDNDSRITARDLATKAYAAAYAGWDRHAVNMLWRRLGIDRTDDHGNVRPDTVGLGFRLKRVAGRVVSGRRLRALGDSEGGRSANGRVYQAEKVAA